IVYLDRSLLDAYTFVWSNPPEPCTSAIACPMPTPLCGPTRPSRVPRPQPTRCLHLCAVQPIRAVHLGPISPDPHLGST
ncbi:unnamed protein product, partial [Musa textilis]